MVTSSLGLETTSAARALGCGLYLEPAEIGCGLYLEPAEMRSDEGIVSFAATVLGLFEQIEQPACVRAREGVQTVGLSLFDGILRGDALGAKL